MQGHSRPSAALVVPVNCFDPRTGTGQRTAILFQALRRMGDVVVIILAEREYGAADAFFPGATGILTLPTDALSSKVPSKAGRIMNALGRIMMPQRTFAAQPGLGSSILAALDKHCPRARDGDRLVAFRYARTLAFTGLKKDPSNRLTICVDVDDRDDQKIDQQIRLRLGPGLAKIVALLWRGRFRRHLTTLLARSSVVFLAKEQDRLRSLSARQLVIPNVPFSTPTAALVTAEDTPETLLFVGVASYRPNLAGVIWFLRSCWPAIRAARPSATVRIVGLGDWSALPADLTAQPGVEVVGTVEDLATEYARARAAICPIREGAGSQIKVIEACAFARPVVSTTFASGGFGAEIERNLSVASDPEGFAKACIDLLADPARAARQGAALRQLQQATHSRAAVEGLILSTLSDLLAQTRPQSGGAAP